MNKNVSNLFFFFVQRQNCDVGEISIIISEAILRKYDLTVNK